MRALLAMALIWSGTAMAGEYDLDTGSASMDAVNERLDRLEYQLRDERNARELDEYKTDMQTELNMHSEPIPYSGSTYRY